MPACATKTRASEKNHSAQELALAPLFADGKEVLMDDASTPLKAASEPVLDAMLEMLVAKEFSAVAVSTCKGMKLL